MQKSKRVLGKYQIIEISLENHVEVQEGAAEVHNIEIPLENRIEHQEPLPNIIVPRRGVRSRGGGIRGVRIHGGLAGGTGRDLPAQEQPRGRHRRPIQPLWYWNRIYPKGLYRPRQIPFTGRERIMQPLPTKSTPLDFFKLYITDNIIDHLVVQTNLYAQQFIEREHNNLRPNSLVHEWQPTDRAEISTLLGILILMGIVHKPKLTMYWSTDTLLATPIFNQVMRRDRFLILIKFLHFADNRDHNTDDQGRDKLYKC